LAVTVENFSRASVGVVVRSCQPHAIAKAYGVVCPTPFGINERTTRPPADESVVTRRKRCRRRIVVESLDVSIRRRAMTRRKQSYLDDQRTILTFQSAAAP